jgi:hypothetical protein
MSNPQAISYADLSIINRALSAISTNVSGIHMDLGNLHTKHSQLESQLQQLADSFADYVRTDAMQKSLQLAETRVGNLRQDLQIRFGYYAEVRRMATGILQGVDAGIVGDDTLKFTTEEVMIKAPGYWLAPALVALAAWIRDDKGTNGKALTEALKRDDYKTTLFFMLVMRRLKRNEASLKWLERYFMHQNPRQIDREFVVILEAITTGVFPPAARQLMMTNVKDWLRQLTQADNFINEQKSQWIKHFIASRPQPDSDFPLLSQFATNWDIMDEARRAAKTHGLLYAHFNWIISSSSDFSKGVKVQLDEILSLLVTNFDDEELPLQQQVRLNQLIIEMDGDKVAAQEVLNTEQYIFEEKVDFLQLLTNASFNPELSGATRVTQALAVSISQPWIVEAYDTFTGMSRNKIPATVELEVEGFTAATRDGSDEAEIVRKHDAYYKELLAYDIKQLPVPFAGVAVGALICLLGFWAFSLHVIAGIVGLGIGGVLIGTHLKKYFDAKKAITDNNEARHLKAREVLRGCIAETVDYRKEVAREDAKAETVRALLSAITPEDFSSVSKETARNII